MSTPTDLELAHGVDAAPVRGERLRAGPIDRRIGLCVLLELSPFELVFLRWSSLNKGKPLGTPVS